MDEPPPQKRARRNEALDAQDSGKCREKTIKCDNAPHFFVGFEELIEKKYQNLNGARLHWAFKK